MTTPPLDPNTAVFLGFSLSKFPFTSPTCSSHSVRVTTQPASGEPNGQPQCQHVPHSQRGGERQIQFILHIKGLKCRLPHITDMKETVIAIDLSGESQSPIWKTEGQKQTNKEVRTNIVINRLC